MNRIKLFFASLIVFVSSVNSSFAVDYYWVGGNGNWSDYAAHWAESSGGSSFHTQVPGPLDNVIFNTNSLSGKTIVTMDQTIVSCRNFTVASLTDSLIFYSNAVDPTLSIYGSTALSPKLKITDNIKLYFLASSGINTFLQNGASINCWLTFDNTGGSWKILDSMNVYAIIILNGNFDASNKKITAGVFKKEGTNTSIVNFSNTKIFTFWFILNDNESNDLTDNFKIYTTGAQYGGAEITLHGPDLIIDSIFTFNETEIDLNGDGRIHYMKMQNHDLFRSIFSGVIDHLDVTNVDLYNNYDDVTIGRLSLNNSRNILIHYKFTVDVFSYTGILDCNNFLKFSSIDTDPVILNIKNQPILNYCALLNIDASAFPINVTNGIDLGVNTGITFLSYAGATTLYRIGDGLWSDPSKWSYTSNGPPANCRPTDYTSVIFDNFSFISPENTLDIDNGTCKNITVTNLGKSLKLLGVLNCHGSFLSNTALTDAFFTINFAAGADSNFIQLANNEESLWQLIFFDGNYFFRSDIICNSFINKGAKLHTKNFDLKTSAFSLYSGYFNASASLIDVDKFYDETLPSFKNFEHADVIVSDNIYLRSILLHTFGTITLEGMPQFWYVDANSMWNIKTKHLYIKSSLLIVGHYIQCDTLSITKGCEVNIQLDSLDFTELTSTGISQCGKLTTIRSASSLKLNAQKNVIFNDFVFENIVANTSNGIIYTAINSIDGLNNSGITFVNRQATSLYWIGGNGNWDDPLHWSQTSGGTSSGCTPTRIDNVYFDENSFSGTRDTIIVNDLIECNNFYFQSSKKLLISSVVADFVRFRTFNIYGSYFADSNLVHRFINVVFRGNAPASVNAQKSTFYGIQIQKSAKTTFTSDFNAHVFDAYSGSTAFVNANLVTESFIGKYDNLDSLIVIDSKISTRSYMYLYVTNRRVYCKSNMFEFVNIDFTSSGVSIGNDSLSIHIGNVSFFDSTFYTTPSDIGLILKNVSIDTLYISNDIHVPIDLKMFNTSIDYMLSFNDELHIHKVDWYHLPIGDGNEPYQNNKFANIKNAHMNSYTNEVENVSFDYLKVYPGVTLNIFDGDTLYVNNALDVTGSPSKPIEIGSTTNGQQAYIQNRGSVCGEYIYIHDNKVLSKPAYAGYLSSDVANNSGWVFNASCDTILCSYDKTPCENGSVQLNVISDQILINTTWSGPKGFVSTELAPVLNDFTQKNKGFYTFTSTQGKCSLYVDVFSNPFNPIYNELAYGFLTVAKPYVPLSWYHDGLEIPNEHGGRYYPYQTGSYQALTTSSRGCTYLSEAVSFLSAEGAGIKPHMTYIGLTASYDIKIDWEDLEGESGYIITGSSPSDPDVYTVIESPDADVISTTVSAGVPGEYCFYVRGFYGSPLNVTLPSDTLCLTIVTTDLIGGIKQQTLFYPNPNHTGTLIVEPAVADSYQISIETMLGEKIYYKDALSGQQKLILNLADGVYILKIISGGYSTSDKLIIVR